MFLSIIIPLFNCEKYISATLDSILDQGLSQKEYEIIVINDGSTDNSLSIVERYSQIHSSIKIYTQSNHGVSAARNWGLEIAKGEYVHFVDGDDQMEANSYVRLKELTKCGTDLVLFDYYRIEPYVVTIEKEKIHKMNIKFVGNIEDFVRIYGLHVSACFFWFKRSLLVDNKISFENYKLGEDGLFCLRVLHLYSKTIVYTDAKIYKYIIHGGSALRNNNREHLKSIIEGSFSLYDEYIYIINGSKYGRDMFRGNMDSLRYVFVTHLLRGNFPIKYNIHIIQRMKSKQILPLQNNIMRDRIVNLFMTNGVTLWCASLIHRYIFTPFIKPFRKTV